MSGYTFWSLVKLERRADGIRASLTTDQAAVLDEAVAIAKDFAERYKAERKLAGDWEYAASHPKVTTTITVRDQSVIADGTKGMERGR